MEKSLLTNVISSIVSLELDFTLDFFLSLVKLVDAKDICFGKSRTQDFSLEVSFIKESFNTLEHSNDSENTQFSYPTQ